MTKNPFINAVSASLYIVAIVTTINFLMRKGPDNEFFAPIIFLSLLTLSASFMTYVFGYQPLLLFMDGKRKEALDLFLKTVGIFGAITALIVIIYSSGIFS